MRVRLLGPLELEGTGGGRGLGGPKERALLAYLALHAGTAVGVTALVDALWPEDPPRTATRTVQAYVSRLRRTIADHNGWVLEPCAGGWRLRVPDDGLDVAEVERALAAGRRAVAEGDHLGAAFTFAAALQCWRGVPLAELAALPWAQAEQARLEELRLEVVEERIDAELACGRSGALVAELERLCRDHPLRERLWGQRMTALYRAGRQADALRAYQELRTTLRDDLGLDPSPATVRIEQQILDQDPALERPPAAAVHAGGSSPSPLPSAVGRLRRDNFVGRASELAVLASAWEAAVAGAVQVVLVAGEPGIGKTTLAAEQAFAAASDGGTVLFGRCDEESLVPFQPIVEALSHYVLVTEPDVLRRQLGSQLADLALLVPHLGRRLPEVADVRPTGAETERYRLFEAVPALLRAASRAAPVLLVLDDLHWADQPTLQLLQHLLRRGPERLLVVATYRDTELVRTHPLAETLAELRRTNVVARLPIRGLRRAEVADLVGAAASPGADADHALADSLWEGTEGNPLFLREILRHLAETGAIERVDGAGWRAVRRIDQLGIPEGLREVIGRRLTRLSDATNAALRAGSVLGRELRIDVLERVTELTADELLDAFEEATAAGVLDEVPGAPGRYTFTHALVRAALYDELSLTRRVRIHQRIGEALERICRGAPDGPHTAELAHHFAQAAVAGQADKAIDYARRAAAHSASVAAYEEGVRHLAVALEVIDDAGASTADRADLLIRTGDLHWWSGNTDAARQAFDDAMGVIGDTDHERLAIATLGYAGANQRSVWVDMALRNDRAIALLRQALERLDGADGSLRAHLLSCLARELARVPGSHGEQVALAAEALAMARRVGDPLTTAHILLDVCLATYGPDTVGARADMAAEAATIAAAVGDRQLEGHAALHRFHALAEQCELDAARVHLSRATELLTELRDPAAEYLLPCYAGGLATLEGRLDDAMDLTMVGFHRGHERGDPNSMVVFGGGTLATYLYADRGGELLDLVSQVYDVYPALQGCAAAIEAGLLAELGHDVECRAALDRVDPADLRSLPHDPFWTFAAHCLARAYWRTCDADRASTLHRLLLPYADQFAGIATVGFGPVHLALAWCAAAMGRVDVAEAHLDAAAEVAARNGWHAVVAEVQLRRAAVLVARGTPGDEVRARALVTDVEATAGGLGLAGLIADAARLRAALDGTPAPARRRPVMRRRDRAKGRLATGGRAAVAWWTRNDGDDDLVRRFGSARAQRALFTAMTKAYQPAMSYGCHGDIEVELRVPDDGLEPIAPDWWTIELHASGATARPGRSAEPLLTVRTTLPDFIRLCSGELTFVQTIVGGLVRLDGDVVLAARLPLMFGAVQPLVPPR